MYVEARDTGRQERLPRPRLSAHHNIVRLVRRTSSAGSRPSVRSLSASKSSHRISTQPSRRRYWPRLRNAAGCPGRLLGASARRRRLERAVTPWMFGNRSATRCQANSSWRGRGHPAEAGARARPFAGFGGPDLGLSRSLLRAQFGAVGARRSDADVLGHGADLGERGGHRSYRRKANSQRGRADNRLADSLGRIELDLRVARPGRARDRLAEHPVGVPKRRPRPGPTSMWPMTWRFSYTVATATCTSNGGTVTLSPGLTRRRRGKQ